jgi:hypothetical protein
MPLVTLTLRQTKLPAFKDVILGAVHAALIRQGVPANDLFQKVLELSAQDFRFDPTYPDLSTPRNDDFVLIEILWSVGRSVKIKKKFLQDLMDGLKQASLDPENVMVCFKETAWENWSFAGGRLLHT